MNPELNATEKAVEELNVCKTCSNEFVGKFCNRCGEKVISQHDRSIIHFLEGVFHVITHVDSKIFKNLKLMITNPGILSKNYAMGRRQPFMKPVPMFFVANLIYFLFPIFETFNTSFNSQVTAQPYSEIVRPAMERKMKEKNLTFDQLAEKYNSKTATYSKLMLILLVPAFAVVFAIMNFKRSRFFADHLLMGLEFMSYQLFFNTILLSVLVQTFAFIALKVFGIDVTSVINAEWKFILPVTIASILYFLYRSQRTFYEQKIWAAALKAGVFLYLTMYVIYFYRFVLFHVTMSFI